MKKILLGCMIATFSVHGLAQSNNPLFSLASIESSDGLEFEMYSYNSDHLMVATELLTTDGILVIDSLFYDEMNNVNKLDRYQLINDVWTHVSYIDYTYDENGNRTSRTNYNSFGGPEFYIGGVYTYLYEDGVRNGWELSMGGNLVEKATLAYNEDGKLSEELVKTGWGNGPFENSWKADYVYNEDGTLKNTLMNHWDAGSWNVVSSDWFEYDEHGNCIEWTHKNGNSVYDRYEYEYDLNYNFDQIVFLYNPEEDIATKTLVEMNNKLMLSHWSPRMILEF